MKTVLRNLLLLAFLFLPINAYAQTQVTIQNPLFALAGPLPNSCGANCAYNNGPIPGWDLQGVGGSFKAGSYMPSLAAGTVFLYLNGGTVSQGLGSIQLQPNSVYTVTTQIGQRSDGLQSAYTITLSSVALSGQTSTILATGTGTNANITPGTFAPRTISYTTGANPNTNGGNITISISANGGGQLEVGGVVLSYVPTGTTVTPPPPPPPTCKAPSVALGWFNSTTVGVTGYRVYRGTVSGGPYTLLTNVPITVPTTGNPSYTDTTVVAGTTYYYVTTALIGTNESGYSPQVPAQP